MVLTIIGKHNKIPDSEFDKKELAMGIKIEYEHTNDLEMAKAIAKDHLYEFSDYYSRLEIMERKDFWNIISAGILLIDQAKKLKL